MACIDKTAHDPNSWIARDRRQLMPKQLYDIGMVGLGVMGRNLVLTMADHGFAVAGNDKDLSKGQAHRKEGAGKKVDAGETVRAFVEMLAGCPPI